MLVLTGLWLQHALHGLEEMAENCVRVGGQLGCDFGVAAVAWQE